MESKQTYKSLIRDALVFAFNAITENILPWVFMAITVLGFSIVGWAIMVLLSMTFMGTSISIFYSANTKELISQGFVGYVTPMSIMTSIMMIVFVLFYAASMFLGLIHTMIQFYTTNQIHYRPYLNLSAIMAFMAANLILIPAISIGMILLIIPGLYVIIRSMFTSYYIVDHNLGPIEAIQASWALTRGKTQLMSLLFIVTFLFNWVPVVGWLISSLMTLYVYEQIVDKRAWL